MRIFPLILASGKGSRLNTSRPKCLYPINYPDGELPIILNTLRTLTELGKYVQVDRPTITVRPEHRQSIQFLLENRAHRAKLITDPGNTPGTGGGIMDCFREFAPQSHEVGDAILIAWGDIALFRVEILLTTVLAHFVSRCSIITFPTKLWNKPEICFVRNAEGHIDGLGHRGDFEKGEQDCCIFLVDLSWLARNLDQLRETNRENTEFDFVYAIPKISRSTKRVIALPIATYEDIRGINTKHEAKEVNRFLESLSPDEFKKIYFEI